VTATEVDFIVPRAERIWLHSPVKILGTEAARQRRTFPHTGSARHLMRLRPRGATITYESNARAPRRGVTMSTLASSQHSPAAVETTFGRVLVGIDGSPESLEAARQAALLQEPGGTLTLLAAWSLAPPLVAPGLAPPAYEKDEASAQADAERALHVAKTQLPSADVLIVRGFATHALIDEIGHEQSTVVAVGSHGQGRATGIIVGSTATSLVHNAPCSVLVTRQVWHDVPRRIAVGVDGSPESAAAYATARHLADRFDGELTVVVAEGGGGRPVDLAGVSMIVGDRYHVIPEDPVPALVAASADADLLVVGSRGLHGLKSLGSVSEQVAHRAECSTLIVRAS
jgi:nucleotide-binding universal stress UspA family protein